MMSKLIKKSETPEGRAIWEGVSRAAQNVPVWMKEKVETAARESAQIIREQEKSRNNQK